MNSTSGFRTKTHFQVLDGLRGVAALVVVLYHLCEANANGDRIHQPINHGYLAVDFFFMLSGFVVAYAYDDRWRRMTTRGFFIRRLIRLQPMVIAGSLIGAAFFYTQHSPEFRLISLTPVWKMLLVMLIGCTMLPLPAAMDIRGWSEMYPLNGPGWSLFFEYIANILYAFVLRRLTNRWLGLLALLSAVFLVQLAVFGGSGDLIGGWSLDPKQLHIGFARVLFPFIAGMLLMRTGLRFHSQRPFYLCSLLLIAGLCLPRFGGAHHLWANGLYESLCILVLFPAIVALGAGQIHAQAVSDRLCRLLGDLSYPLYITHYPLIYLYTAWIARGARSLHARVTVAALIFASAIAIAALCLRFYDEPIRHWLSRRFLTSGAEGRTAAEPGLNTSRAGELS